MANTDNKQERPRLDVASDATISYAKEGDLSAAWTLVSEIEGSLRKGYVAPALAAYAADFFGALLDIRDEKDAGKEPSSSELMEALKKLHIVRERGGTKQDPELSYTLAARIGLLKLAGLSDDAAYRALECMGPNAKSYRTAWERHGRLMSSLTHTHGLTAELEAIAGSSFDTLLRDLVAQGGVPELDALKMRSQLEIAKRLADK